MAVVYLHRKKDSNDIFYVGIGKHRRRAYSKCFRNKHWHRVVNKHGFNVEFVNENINYEIAKLKEIELIKHYGRMSQGGILVNQTDGGDGCKGYKHTEEWKKQNSLRNKGKTIPDYQKESIRQYMQERVVSDETRQKTSETVKKIMAERFPVEQRRIKHKRKDLIWINKDDKNTRVGKSVLKQYTDSGWQIGRCLTQVQKDNMSKKGSVWMYHEQTEKMVLKNQYNIFLQAGWKLGRMVNN